VPVRDGASSARVEPLKSRIHSETLQRPHSTAQTTNLSNVPFPASSQWVRGTSHLETVLSKNNNFV